MLERVEENKTYISPSGLLFKVLYLGKHGQDCSQPMVIYTNLVATSDSPVGTVWTIDESLFMKLFTENHEQDKVAFNGEDFDLIRKVLLAEYEKPRNLITGTINWAAHMASRLKPLE